jgi:hypothetical protein
MKPTRGNHATSTNAKKPHANNCSAKKSPADKAPLAAHLQKFAKAVADDHSDVEAAILDKAARISFVRDFGIRGTIERAARCNWQYQRPLQALLAMMGVPAQSCSVQSASRFQVLQLL